MDNRTGLVIVHTGEGKGKTTAALGMAIRSWGNHLRVLILQFIKGSWTYGELKAIETLNAVDGRIEIRQGGFGFTRKGNTGEAEHRIAAEELLHSALREISGGTWDMVILDEFNYAYSFGLIHKDELEQILNARPPQTHLVFTGRNASEELVDRADLVTEMRLIKHPYQKGIKAQRGIEF
ncbi:cob(I)yrinic acid a,c-diamide adenosyltransferase [Selenomonas sp. F0473]|uniref:cob(I)yrinic acid a,c-diamide adenosyltransferase n=1 Tax=Selenomonas sp. F0473 TaxID=999423 RepID=UPI00029EA285|nr:cob(I)yrinic acid a,c-diamide adenosyltransferase [Selenomonas sp. F0473]EKU71649.1 cob(I)yrinic acid a,c-diamide adenosyltransferase [Selenomonas sp. F0473]